MEKVWELYQPMLPGYASNLLLRDGPAEENEPVKGILRSMDDFFDPSKEPAKELPTPELPINNYLKTKDQIEAEFRFVASDSKASYIEKEIPSASYSRIVKTTEDYSYLHSIDQAMLAPLEENY